MITSIFYILLSILGLSFLIFIHELGHYYMAIRVGMRVETFSIGFGRPIYSWMRNGVKWQFGWLPFGGYVKIAGMEGSVAQDPYSVKDGYFGKKPIDRILVSIMGPLVNIVFAFLAFTMIWLVGGREKNFSEFTHKIGWLDKTSQLYQKGVRPGDEIDKYDGANFSNAKDHITAPLMSSGTLLVEGSFVEAEKKTPFSFQVNTYTHPAATNKDVKTVGIMSPANYVIVGQNSKEEAVPKKGSNNLKFSVAQSGIENGDRIVWVNGVKINSSLELSQLINEEMALLTINRNGQILQRRVPKVKAGELRLEGEFKEELIDWQYESDLNLVKLRSLLVIPYNLTNDAVVEAKVPFIDQESQKEAFPKNLFSKNEEELQAGDKIIAVSGLPISHSYELISYLQLSLQNIIVQRDELLDEVASFATMDQKYASEYSDQDLLSIVDAIGTDDEIKKINNLVLLNPIEAKLRKDFDTASESTQKIAKLLKEKRIEISKMPESEKKAKANEILDQYENQKVIGIAQIQDAKVNFNPGPFALFGQVFRDIWTTLKGLFSGNLSPKWLSGPIGIVQVVHDQSMVSFKEALYWLGAISLNLGVLNLLPLPVLDGGTICFSLYEMVTGRRLKAKTLERLIIPFALLLIGFFVYITYHDLVRIFTQLF